MKPSKWGLEKSKNTVTQFSTTLALLIPNPGFWEIFHGAEHHIR